jgi:hypothetical protein
MEIGRGGRTSSSPYGSEPPKKTATSALRCRHCLKRPRGGVAHCYGTNRLDLLHWTPERQGALVNTNYRPRRPTRTLIKWIPRNVPRLEEQAQSCATRSHSPIAVTSANTNAPLLTICFNHSTGCYNRSRNRLRPSIRTSASGAIALIASCSAARFS